MRKIYAKTSSPLLAAKPPEVIAGRRQLAVTGAARRRRTAPILSEENLSEGGPEVGIEDRIDDRIEKTVEVAEPADDADEEARVVAGVAAERPDEGDDEEGQPAADERPGDDGERRGRLAFALLFQLLLGASATHLRRSATTAAASTAAALQRLDDALVDRVGPIAVLSTRAATTSPGGGGRSVTRSRRSRRSGRRSAVTRRSVGRGGGGSRRRGRGSPPLGARLGGHEDGHVQLRVRLAEERPRRRTVRRRHAAAAEHRPTGVPEVLLADARPRRLVDLKVDDHHRQQRLTTK